MDILLEKKLHSNFTPKDYAKGVYAVTITDKEARIKKEVKRLKSVFKDLDKNKLKTVDSLIHRAAFITVSLEDLEDELNAYGWTETYTNGRNQEGVKKAAAAEAHISLTKNLNAIMKQLLDLVPPAQKKESKLAEMMRT